MEDLLNLLQKDARRSPEELAELLGSDADAVSARITELEQAGAILGYQAVVDPEHLDNGEQVRAFIEVKLMPERDGGFNRLAERISKFEQVHSCFLMSGGYDLMVIVQGESLRSVAQFVAEKLSSLEGVTATATHFHLKTYKQSGFLAHGDAEGERLPVAP